MRGTLGGGGEAAVGRNIKHVSAEGGMQINKPKSSILILKSRFLLFFLFSGATSDRLSLGFPKLPLVGLNNITLTNAITDWVPNSHIWSYDFTQAGQMQRQSQKQIHLANTFKE